MEPLALTPDRGWIWIKQGFALFMKAPLLWPALMFCGLIGIVTLAAIPVIGDPLASLLMPVLLASLMIVCRSFSNGNEFELPKLVETLKQHSSQLITLGGITLVAKYLILGLMKATGGAAFVNLMLSGQRVQDHKIIEQALEGAGTSIALGFILFSVLLMATQFAPLLIVFKNCAPVQALKLSLQAFKYNIAPMAIYSSALMLLGVVASIPMMIGWMVLLPVLMTSWYVCYNEIFPQVSNE